MNNYLVTITFGGNYEEVNVDAATPEQAVELVKTTLSAKVLRWANVFVG